MGWIETYMNNATIRAELGASEDVTFASCNMDVNQGFLFQVCPALLGRRENKRVCLISAAIL